MSVHRNTLYTSIFNQNNTDGILWWCRLVFRRYFILRAIYIYTQYSYPATAVTCNVTRVYRVKRNYMIRMRAHESKNLIARCTFDYGPNDGGCDCLGFTLLTAFLHTHTHTHGTVVAVVFLGPVQNAPSSPSKTTHVLYDNHNNMVPPTDFFFLFLLHI